MYYIYWDSYHKARIVSNFRLVPTGDPQISYELIDKGEYNSSSDSPSTLIVHIDAE